MHVLVPWNPETHSPWLLYSRLSWWFEIFPDPLCPWDLKQRKEWLAKSSTTSLTRDSELQEVVIVVCSQMQRFQGEGGQDTKGACCVSVSWRRLWPREPVRSSQWLGWKAWTLMTKAATRKCTALLGTGTLCSSTRRGREQRIVVNSWTPRGSSIPFYKCLIIRAFCSFDWKSDFCTKQAVRLDLPLCKFCSVEHTRMDLLKNFFSSRACD